VWDWELMNDVKPIWTRPAKEVEEDEYKAFYKTFSKVCSLHLLLTFLPSTGFFLANVPFLFFSLWCLVLVYCKSLTTADIKRLYKSIHLIGVRIVLIFQSSLQDTDEPLSHIHFTAEGEVTFKSILFVPVAAPRGMFDEYGTKKNDFIKLFVRRVFITDDFNDMMPKYLNFVRGVVSDVATRAMQAWINKGN
jgi:HSP90 family molecular chaperone